MALYSEEKIFLNRFREKVLSKEPVSKQEMIEMTEKFEELIEMNTVTIKIIDRLMMNYDRLKQQVSQKESS